jgi:hypothetical protein
VEKRRPLRRRAALQSCGQGPPKKPRQELLHIRKLLCSQDEPLEVALRRLTLEIRVREDDGNADDGRDEIMLFIFPEEDPDEPVRLVERRHLHRPLVLEPDAVPLADNPALYFEDEDTASRVGDDEIGLREICASNADLERMPSGPAGGQG